MLAIKTEGLLKKYGWFFSRRKIVAVNNLNLEVEEKQIFGFLGPNGAGKTTTIKMLLGLVIPDKGKACIFGTDPDDKDIKSRVGFLPDAPSFYNHLSGREFVMFCGKLMHLDRMERARRADELLEKMGLSDAGDDKVEGYSRGMLQRLGIAQALINNPDLIILDEPVSGLDPLGRREVKQILLDLRDEGRTVFFSSHILADVEEMCDEVSILNRGRLLEKGTLASILKPKGMRLYVLGVQAEALDQLEPLVRSIQKEGERWALDMEISQDREKVVEKVRQLGGKVDEAIAKKETLEEAFLRRIEEDERMVKEGGRQ